MMIDLLFVGGTLLCTFLIGWALGYSMGYQTCEEDLTDLKDAQDAQP